MSSPAMNPAPVISMSWCVGRCRARRISLVRSRRLAQTVASAEQVLITAAVPQDVPEELVGVRYDVSEGSVTRRAA